MPAESTIGEIYMAGINFAPRGHALCLGQLLSINQNQALFSLLGTSFGGNGSQTFGLPDLQGRIPIGIGQGPGLTNRVQGAVGGVENETLNPTQIPSHTHTLNAVNLAGTASSPAGAFLGNSGAMDKEYVATGPLVPMNAAAIGSGGGNQPHNNMPPFVVLTFYIATVGIFPSRP